MFNRAIIIILYLTIFTGCQIKIEPVLNSSLGMSAFENMKKVQRHDASIALYLDPKIKKLMIEREIRAGNFSFPVGNALSVKLIKALTYTFNTVYLIDKPISPLQHSSSQHTLSTYCNLSKTSQSGKYFLLTTIHIYEPYLSFMTLTNLRN